MTASAGSPIRRAVAIVCALLLPLSPGFAQVPAGPLPAPSDTQQAAPVLSPDELNNLVAPLALYPDPLLSQVLAASTYPLEIVEAQQWLQQHSNLQGSQLMDAAREQNWDPSVQAVVAFPDALRLLGSDIRWTTALGNAFLAQQADAMRAVQGMRARAMANGKLATTPQQVVTTATQDNQSAIEIQPADPQVIYVPVYDPAYVWGPPVWGGYPDLWYPGEFGFGFGFGPGIFMGGFFPGWAGWGGWGWGCGWFGNGFFGNGLFINAGFFNRYGFRGEFGRRGFEGRNFGGRGAWTHDPGHRTGVPYPNQSVASRFNSNRFNGSRANAASVTGGGRNSVRSRTGALGAGANASGWQHFNGNNRAGNNVGSYRQTSPNYGSGSSSQGNRPSAQSYRGYNSAPNYRSAVSNNRSFAPAYSAPRQNYSAPRSYAPPRQSFSAPRASPAPHFSGGGSSFSGGHSGFSGGHSGSSGGHAGGGGGGRR